MLFANFFQAANTTLKIGNLFYSHIFKYIGQIVQFDGTQCVFTILHMPYLDLQNCKIVIHLGKTEQLLVFEILLI